MTRLVLECQEEFKSVDLEQQLIGLLLRDRQ